MALRDEAPSAHVFSLNGAHLHVLPRFAGIVKCAMSMGRRAPAYVTRLTFVEDGSEASLSLPYAMAFEMHAELERVDVTRRIKLARPSPQAAAMALFYELGRLHGALKPHDQVIVLCFDELVEAELSARPGITVVNVRALYETDAFWRDRERALLLNEPDLHQNSESTVETNHETLPRLETITEKPSEVALVEPEPSLQAEQVALVEPEPSLQPEVVAPVEAGPSLQPVALLETEPSFADLPENIVRN